MLNQENKDFVAKRISNKPDEKKLETKIQKKRDPINQIKNIVQEKSLNDIKTNKIKTKNISIKSFSDLIDLCNVKKDVKLKYELENNVKSYIILAKVYCVSVIIIPFCLVMPLNEPRSEIGLQHSLRKTNITHCMLQRKNKL